MDEIVRAPVALAPVLAVVAAVSNAGSHASLLSEVPAALPLARLSATSEVLVVLPSAHLSASS